MLPTGFPTITTPGDIAAAGLGFVLGFVIDVAFGFTASPATTAGVVAVGCLGIKYFVQARTDLDAEKRQRRALEERKKFLVKPLPIRRQRRRYEIRQDAARRSLRPLEAGLGYQ
jgi:hypothetical protein